MKHLNYADRLNIQLMAQAGKSPKEIAKAMGVHVATIYREYKHGGKGYAYSALEAQKAVGGNE